MNRRFFPLLGSLSALLLVLGCGPESTESGTSLSTAQDRRSDESVVIEPDGLVPGLIATAKQLIEEGQHPPARRILTDLSSSALSPEQEKSVADLNERAKDLRDQ